MSDYRERVYKTYISTHYGSLNVLDPGGFVQAMRNYDSMWETVLPRDRSVMCLDIGCGPGQFLYYLQQRGFANVAGVDLSPEAVVLARQMGLSVMEAHGIAFLREARSRGHQYGLVSALDVVEHLEGEEMLELLDAIHAVLSDEGIVLIKTTNAASLLGTYARYMDITHRTSYTEESLREALRTTGFADLRIVRYRPSSFRQAVRFRLKWVLHWIVYRLAEGRAMPACIDLDILGVAAKGRPPGINR